MTREEAMRIAQGLITDFKCESDTMVDFCNTVIEALKAEPCKVYMQGFVVAWMPLPEPYKVESEV